MNFRQQDIIPDKSNPFKNDPFSRHLFANKLNEIIRTTSGITIFLHSPWGHGKTTFIRQWQQLLLNQDNTRIAVLDAFAKDYIDDPLVLFMAEIKTLIDDVILDEEGRQDKELVEKVQSTWGSIKKYGAKIAIGAAKQTVKRYVGDIFEGEHPAEDVGQATIEQVENYLQSRITGLSEEINIITKFKEMLAEAASIFQLRNNGFPLTIVIDELDRCRPDFALNLLEQIKHLFDVEGVCFVIATDKDKLSQHVAHAYGLKSNDLGYITKFGDIFCSLPVRPFGQNESIDGYIGFIELWGSIITGDDKHVFQNGYFMATLATLVTANQSSMRNVILMLKKAYFKLGTRSLRGNTQNLAALAVITFMSVEHPNELQNVLNHQDPDKGQERWKDMLHVLQIDQKDYFKDTKQEICSIVNAIFDIKEESPEDRNLAQSKRKLIHDLIEDFEYLIKLEP